MTIIENKDNRRVSIKLIKRLIRYRGLFQKLINQADILSSKEIGSYTGLSPSLIRQDLNQFGKFSYKNNGYKVSDIYNQLTEILGLNKEYSCIIVGMGNIGQAVFSYYRESYPMMKIKGLFDVNPKIVGLGIGEMTVVDAALLKEFLIMNKIDIGIICTSEKVAQEVCTSLTSGGVKCIWNFASAVLKAPDEIPIDNTHLEDSLMVLAYRMKAASDGQYK